MSDASQGVQLATMQKLAQYWGNDYDWRKSGVEAERPAAGLSPQSMGSRSTSFTFVRKMPTPCRRSSRTAGSDQSSSSSKIIGPLSDPVAYGGKAGDSFDVVIPSLPGYGFSGKPDAAGWDPIRVARAWIVLMKRLGYTRYVAQGGRLGERGNGADGFACASRTDWHSHQHAGQSPSQRCKGSAIRRTSARRFISRGKRRVGTNSISSINTASAMRWGWRTVLRRYMRLQIRQSVWLPGCSITTHAVRHSSRRSSTANPKASREKTF